MNRHHVIQPVEWLTPKAWAALEPMIDSMPTDGGCVIVMFDAQPDRQNYLHCITASFTGKQRAALRKAIIKAGTPPVQQKHEARS